METSLCRPLEIHSKVEAKFHLDVIYRSPAGKNNYHKGFLFTEARLRSAIEQSHHSAADGAKLHVDHIVPVSRGGQTVMSNLQTVCETCNLGKGDSVPRDS